MTGPEKLTRIVFTLTEAINEARGIGLCHGINAEFREVVKHARGMDDILLEALLGLEPNAPIYLSVDAEILGDMVRGLEDLAELPDGKSHQGI